MRGLRTLAQANAVDGGLYVGTPPLGQPKGTTPNAENVAFRDGEMRQRPGTVALGSSVTGAPTIIAPFRMSDGTTKSVLVTVDKCYWYNDGWTDITDTTLTAAVTDNHSWANWLGTTFLFTNATDAVKAWSGSGDIANLGGGTDYQSTGTTHIAEAVAVWENRVHLFGTTEDSTSCPTRHRYSELGYSDQWTIGGADKGGFNDLVESPGTITTAANLLDNVVVFKDESIVIARYVGSNSFAYDTYTTSEGCTAPRTVVGRHQFLFFAGQDNVYQFDGNDMQAIGGPIRDELFRDLPPEYLGQAHAQLWRDESLYVLFVPIASSGITKAYAYDYLAQKWTRWDMPNASAAGVLTLGSATTWGDVTSDTWGEYSARTWGSLFAQEGRESIAVGYSDGSVRELSYSLPDDAGSDINEWYDTPELYGDDDYVNEYKRWLEFVMDVKGQPLTITYSTDNGQTWHAGGAITPAEGTYSRKILALDVTSRNLRLRLRCAGTSGGFQLRWYAVRGMIRGTR